MTVLRAKDGRRGAAPSPADPSGARPAVADPSGTGPSGVGPEAPGAALMPGRRLPPAPARAPRRPAGVAAGTAPVPSPGGPSLVTGPGCYGAGRAVGPDRAAAPSPLECSVAHGEHSLAEEAHPPGRA